MRLVRASWLLGLLCVASCFGPLRCDADGPQDEGAPYVPYDFSVGELGRPIGTVCKTLDECDRRVSDTCDGRCQCGSDHPCDAGQFCCGGRCVDPFTDHDNCGGCGINCGDGQCVLAAGGAPHCTCSGDVDVDGGSGGGGCSSSLEPTCNGEGLCTCGPSSVGACNSFNADSCGANGCTCGGGPGCSGTLADHCDPADGCRCGSQASCDPKLATSCDPTATDSPCRCAQGPGCQAGTFCCTQNSTCCRPEQFCCLDGCCDHPCLLFGFCGH